MKKNKYSARKIVVNGERFDSQGELSRWNFLVLMSKQKRVTSLQRQIPFSFDLNGLHIAKYIADFSYIDQNGEVVIEDFKGVETDVFKLKKKMMKAFFNIDISISKIPTDHITKKELS